MADGRAFGVLLSLLLFYLEKHNIDPKYITNVKLLDANLVNEVNSNVKRSSIAFIQRIHSTVQTRLNFKRLGFSKRRLNYYANCTASYNPSIITITQSGDIHPLPGPAQRKYCTDIRCLYMNARSLVNKINEFQTLAVDVDCIFAVETWLKSHILNCELLPGFDFTIYRRDRLNRTGGGVLFAVRNEIKSLRRKDLEGNAEILACELRPDSRRKILAIVFYRPPDTNRDYLKELKKTLRCASDAHFDQILLCGDFNLPNIDWSSGTAISHDATHNDLAKLLKDHFMWQMVDFPTRGNNILDLIVTSVPEKVSNVVGFDDILSTDHKLISFELNLRISRKPKIKRAVYNFKKADWVGLNETLRHTPWDMCFVPNDVDSSLSNWCDFFTSAANAHIPKCLIKNVHNHPWIDAELLSMLRQKNIMRRKANKTGSINDNVKFQTLRKSVKQLITQKKREHGCKLKESIINNPKRFWSFVKSSTRDKASPHLLRDGQVFVTDRVVKANKLNSFFHSVFSPKETFTQYSNTESIYSSAAQLPEICVTESEVAKVLKGIDPNKACGPDNIPGMLLFKTADAIAPSLCRLFNQSLSEGCVPLIWKCANIVPVHKNDDPTLATNYRPISLLCIISKVLERCIFNHCFQFLKSHINNIQHGFMQGRSTVTQLLTVYHDILDILASGREVDVVHLDFSKAFDKVSHNLLLNKLDGYGIRGSLLQWFNSYLSHRHHRVVLEGEFSDWLPVTSGVPQGSILGPLLFIIYANDMPDCLDESKLALFADDSKLFRTMSSGNSSAALQSDLNSLHQWSRDWKMTFNIPKCLVLHMSRKRTPSYTNTEYHLGGQRLQVATATKDLGVIVSNNLSWSIHISRMCAKANRTLGLIKRVCGKDIVDQETRKLLYTTLVRSQLEYASSLWSPYTAKERALIENIQRRATKFILNHYGRDMAYKDRLVKLHLLPLEYRREIADLTLVYKYKCGILNVDFSNLYMPVSSHYNTRRTDSNNFRNNFNHNQCYYQNSFFPRSVKLWNNLPHKLKTCNQSVTFFRRQLSSMYNEKLLTYSPP